MDQLQKVFLIATANAQRVIHFYNLNDLELHSSVITSNEIIAGTSIFLHVQPDKDGWSTLPPPPPQVV